MPKIEVVDDDEVIQTSLEQLSISDRSKLPDELTYLITAFTPTQSAPYRAKAYVELTAFCKTTRANNPGDGDEPTPATRKLSQVFTPVIRDLLSETKESTQIEGLSFLTALFQVDWKTAADAFTADGMYELILDCIELLPSPSVALCVAQLVSQACGHKSCRTILTKVLIEWLEIKARDVSEPVLAASAAVALVKQSNGVAEDTKKEGQAPPPGLQERDEGLATIMKKIVSQESAGSCVGDAVEGLAYLSAVPPIKETLSQDAAFLKRLFSLVPRRKSGSVKAERLEPPDFSLLFGVLSIVVNLCTYRPQMTDEDAQLEKLKRMAQAGSKGPEIPAADKDDAVKRRITRLISAGALDAISNASVNLDSPGIRACTAKAFINIIRDRENRGKVLQSGGSRILLSMINVDPTSGQGSDKASIKERPLDALQRETIQSLARLAITSSPLQVFGPNVGVIYDAIRPLSGLLQHSSSNMLQKFEAMMALTNMASHSPEMAARIAQASGLLDRVELLLFEDHELVRRAAMELICNLIVGSDPVFVRYGGEEVTTTAQSKLHVLLAMSDVDDLPTRLAASGALATLTSSPSACQMLLQLQKEKKNVIPILASLVEAGVISGTADADRVQQLGLTHRGLVCFRQFCVQTSGAKSRESIIHASQEAGLLRNLGAIIKGEVAGLGTDVVGLAVEVLKILTK